MIQWKLHCRSRKQKGRINQWQCSISGLAIGWLFRLCFRLRQPSFYCSISDRVVIGRNRNVLILPTPISSGLWLHLRLWFWIFSRSLSSFMTPTPTPTPSLVKTSLKRAKLDSKIGLHFTHRNGPIFRAKTDLSDLQCIHTYVRCVKKCYLSHRYLY